MAILKTSDPEPSITIASWEHADAIRHIYRLVQIDPVYFEELAALATDQPVPEKLIKSLGGFISPPDEREMHLSLENGMVFICVEDGKVVAFSRYITHADKVHQEICSDFNIDRSLREFDRDSFSDWSGHKISPNGKMLKKVHWIDRDVAVLAFNSALAGIENKASGRLAWPVDLAIHPDNQHCGIPNAFVNRANSEFNPQFSFRCFRIFEIRKINDKEVSVENIRSKNAFVNTETKHFAYTEEEIEINSAITLLVRWNYWLKQT